jgi:hypothetical protein
LFRFTVLCADRNRQFQATVTGVDFAADDLSDDVSSTSTDGSCDRATVFEANRERCAPAAPALDDIATTTAPCEQRPPSRRG